MENRKNLIIAVVLSMLVMAGWQYFFNMPAQQAAQLRAQQQAAQQATTQSVEQPATGAPAAVQSAPGNAPGAAPTAAVPLKTRDAALADSPRIAIDTPRIHGSIALTGGRIDDLVLKDYRETVDPTSPQVTLLSPSGAPHGYFIDVGWLSGDGGAEVQIPNDATKWQADGSSLAPGHDVTLIWDNGQGAVFKRVYSVDANYMFTVTQSVDNKGTAALNLKAYSRVVRVGLPAGFVPTSYVLHEGPIGVLDGSLRGIGFFGNPWDYSKFKSNGTENPDGSKEQFDSQGGWLGITDKYWLVAQVIPSDAKVHASAFYDPKSDTFQTDFVAANLSVAPGASGSFSHNVFAGAKEVHVLTAYRDDLQIPLFDRAVDFGFYFFLTKPLFYLLDYIYRLIGNFGVAIMCLTVLVKACMFPLANKSYVSMSKMKALQPQMAVLKERFGDDKQRFNQEVMALYKREKVNPAAGCLPIFVQIPVFYSLYKVLFVTIEMRHAPFFGWIHDLSAPDPTSILNLFGLIPWDPSIVAHIPVIGGALAFINIGIWPLIMGVTMWLQQRLNPTPPDPVQARIFALMPIMFTFMLAHFTAGLVIYWAWNNTLSILQQRFIMWKVAKASQLKKA